MYCLISHALFYIIEHTISLKTIIDLDFAVVAQDGRFWLFLHAQIGAKAIFTSE